MRNLLLSALLLMQAAAIQYQVEAVQYGVIPDFPVSGLVAGAAADRKMDIAMMVWLVRGGGRTVLVDAGFYRPQFFKSWTVRDYARPDEAVADAGVKPGDVTDVVITHAHWDHADGADLFPNARVWIQKDEYEYYTGAAWQPDGQHGGIDPDDVQMLVKLNTSGRLTLVNGEQMILPGIRVYTGGKHTWQSQYVSISTAVGVVVIASDNVYLYENLEKHAPVAQTLDATANLAAQDRMKTIAKIIVPGHDPAVMKRYRRTSPRSVRIDEPR